MTETKEKIMPVNYIDNTNDNTNKFETMFTPQKRKKGLDIGNPKLIKFGKEIDVRTWINENNVDCEIYETLEKYGTLPRNEINLPEIYGELEQLDLRSYLDREIITGNMWESLPIEIRKEFNFDKNKFALLLQPLKNVPVCTCVVGVFLLIVEFVSVRENADDKTRKEYSKALQALQNLPEADFVRLLKKLKDENKTD